MIMKRILSLIAVFSLLLAGCNVLTPIDTPTQPDQGLIPGSTSGNTDRTPVDVEFDKTDDEMFTDRDEQDS